MIRLDDPDAAERIAAEFVRAVYQSQAFSSWPLHSQKPMIRGAEAVIAAIEVPRLPTRSEVVNEVRSWIGELSAYPGAIALRMIQAGWAVEDPEPEVDPAQVEAQLLVTAARKVLDAAPMAHDYWCNTTHQRWSCSCGRTDLRRAVELASGRAKVDG